ncbi:MAG TPA: type II toxin-antitoxin system HicB family antitoxin [Candidatus Hydrogenedentes bacterium]|nr:type II toxin-antitoxin system HicB family antitoxin [Candidatus Hydrogenedentota bacterium]
MNIEYTVIYEQGDSNWGAIVPDLPGCVSIGDTFEEVRANIREAIELYIEELRASGEPIPQPRHAAGSVSVPA